MSKIYWISLFFLRLNVSSLLGVDSARCWPGSPGCMRCLAVCPAFGILVVQLYRNIEFTCDSSSPSAQTPFDSPLDQLPENRVHPTIQLNSNDCLPEGGVWDSGQWRPLWVNSEYSRSWQRWCRLPRGLSQNSWTDPCTDPEPSPPLWNVQCSWRNISSEKIFPQDK